MECVTVFKHGQNTALQYVGVLPIDADVDFHVIVALDAKAKEILPEGTSFLLVNFDIQEVELVNGWKTTAMCVLEIAQ